MALTAQQLEGDPSVIHDPPLARFLFGSRAMAIVWLAASVFVGYQSVTSGWGKVAGYYGLDRFVLPLLGTPWQLGTLIAPNQTRRVAIRPELA